ncbi:hypothetical protein DSCW_40440 [Desulfosarcina widdelii]|uniref:Uncharacterized protein n=1 Tax=Desulfosarcina widdelii TaxID=947919 RepID=A0A5K7ZKT1_9BACT|nr:hypothetical protein DSCW_40440 [Desulfosarcina widdelii]
MVQLPEIVCITSFGFAVDAVVQAASTIQHVADKGQGSIIIFFIRIADLDGRSDDIEQKSQITSTKS